MFDTFDQSMQHKEKVAQIQVKRRQTIAPKDFNAE
jgi:hypothetical protein